ncbi:SDR family oxidoreductase [Candidatus Daviesbacteria bacterium]|nr:SDR family oxidoreductase [Candidatus Daviesbacteria bacterium]
MYSLENRVVFITGASRGIGKECAYEFAKQKSILILTYYKGYKEGELVKRRCLELGSPKVLLLYLDLTNNDSIKRTVAKIIKQLGKISILINNSGVIFWKMAREHTNNEVENQLRVNLEGLIKMTIACLPYIQDMIINMGSAASIGGYEKQSVYGASKWGVRGFTQALAKETPTLKIYNFISGGVATQMKNFQGILPEKIAVLIKDFAQEKYILDSGLDINAREYISYRS